jgi:cytochrome c-type biogenesis protein
MRRFALLVGVALVAAPVALANDARPTQQDLEDEIMCPVCPGETLEQSSSPAAQQVERFIAIRIRAGDSKQEIKDKLVEQYGPRILAAPPREGFDLLAWVLPLAGAVAGALGQPGTARRVVLASLPFIAGFTVVFVVLGAGAAAIGSVLSSDRQSELAGLVLVVLGLTFVGLLPWPERIVAPGLLAGARSRRSSALLGAAFAVCAAPCIGTLIASILVLAADADTVVRGSILLAAYSAGLGLAFVLAGAAFARAMGAFRWLRDHYLVIRVVGGLMLVALGLLLFFHRDWWLRGLVGRFFDWSGLGDF